MNNGPIGLLFFKIFFLTLVILKNNTENCVLIYPVILIPGYKTVIKVISKILIFNFYKGDLDYKAVKEKPSTYFETNYCREIGPGSLFLKNKISRNEFIIKQIVHKVAKKLRLNFEFSFI